MRRFLTCLLALATLPILAQTDVPEIARTLLEEAQHARDTKHFDDAIAKYRRVIEVAPQLASPYVDLGALLHDQGKAEEAYAVFKQGIERAPADRTLLSNAAATALELGELNAALSYVDRAIEANPRDAALYTLRGTVLRALRRDDDAVAALQKAVQLAPGDARAHFALGNALYAVGRKEEAIAAYRRSADLEPAFTRAYYNLGAVLFDMGRDAEALGAYRVALAPIDKAFARNEAVDKIHARAYSNLGAIYIRQQQWQPSIDAYTKALKLDPASANAHYNLGFIFYNTNKLERAEEEYRKALGLDPALPLAYLHLAQIAMKKKDNNAAVTMLTEGLPRFDAETKTLALRTLGRLQLAAGNTSAAVTSLRQNTSDPDSAVLLARILRRDRQYDDALKLLESAPSDNAAVLLGRAMLARDMNDLPREQAALEALLAKNPRPEFRIALGVNLARQGKFDEASKNLAGTKNLLSSVVKRDLKELQDLSSSDPMARGDLGLLLWQSNRVDDARPHLTAALAAIPAWSELALALGDIAYNAHDYARAHESLAIAEKNCDAKPDAMMIGKTDNLCARARHDLALALLAEATASPRQARALADRAAQLDEHLAAAAMFLRANAELAGDDGNARDLFRRAIDLGLPNAAEAMARKVLAQIAENAASEEVQPAEPVVATPRRTVVVFLPDAPAENEKKLFETMTSFVAALSSSSVPLSVEFFRRADDARDFIAANRERVGIVVTNPEFAGDFKPQFQFSHDGQRSYRRVIVVPASSPMKSSLDVRGHSLSIAEGFRDVSGSFANVMYAQDDLTAVANVLTGKTEAALVSEANTLFAQNRGKLKVIYTSGAMPEPVIAFGPMPQSDRDALTSALRSMSGTHALAPLQVSGLVAIEREPRATSKRIEPLTIAPRDLGIPASVEPPGSLALRANVQVTGVAIHEEIFDTP